MGRAEAGRRRAAGVASHVVGGVVVSPEVAAALAARRPVVALESTIVCHGLPHPAGLETARACEAAVRAAGAVPATVAVLGGVPRVGLEPHELERLAELGGRAAKASRRDLPRVCALGLDGATTVSGTMLLAHRAGVRVFVTGGIGGVHRGGEASLDVSADLTELGRTPVCVVCAGVKSILDIPRTLEVLETQGVPVLAYGQDDFPAFFARSSGCRAPGRVDSPAEAAAVVDASTRLGLGGLVVGVPIPPEAAAEGDALERAQQQALREADEQKITGAATTPFLLGRVRELTGGSSLAANIALVTNNARISGAIAAALSQRDRVQA